MDGLAFPKSPPTHLRISSWAGAERGRRREKARIDEMRKKKAPVVGL